MSDHSGGLGRSVKTFGTRFPPDKIPFRLTTDLTVTSLTADGVLAMYWGHVSSFTPRDGERLDAGESVHKRG